MRTKCAKVIKRRKNACGPTRNAYGPSVASFHQKNENETKKWSYDKMLINKRFGWTGIYLALRQDTQSSLCLVHTS